MKEAAAIILSVLLFCLCIFGVIRKAERNIISVISEASDEFPDKLFIIDAGHGGEDGGAVAFDSTEEKAINLEISRKLSLLFDIFGINHISIRTEDISVGDTSLETIRKRKVSDIMRRYEIINSYENSVLISIHQNMFSVEKYSGTQVFYAPEDEDSARLAQIIQNTVRENLQQDNNRKIKAADKSIYLLYNAKRPSVLIECGFLSNMNELDLLKNDSYQLKLAYFLSKAITEFLIT